tara:strand:+ start:198 stop:809 length:612 start_codon:yes stop_codon:yes gene_type:complete
MNKIDSLNLMHKSFEEMILGHPLKKSPDVFSIAKLFGRSDLTQSQRVQLGTRVEIWVNYLLDAHEDIISIKGKNSNLWMNTKTNEISFGGKGTGLKDIDILFNKAGATYYLESKNNLNLDTEKGPETIEKVKTITECLRNNENYSNVVGKIVSVFWDKTNVPISGSIKKSGCVMWFGELSKLLNLGITKSDYETKCKELGKLL